MALAVLYSVPVSQDQNDGFPLLPYGTCHVACLIPREFSILVGSGSVLHLRHRKLILDAFWEEMTIHEDADLGFSLYMDTSSLSSNVIDAAEPSWRAHWAKLFGNLVVQLESHDRAFFSQLHLDGAVEKLSHADFMRRIFS